MKKIELTAKEITAIKKSIKHWEKDIIKRFEKGDEIYNERWNDGTTVNYYSDDCALCKLKAADDCDFCPFVKFYGVGCDEYDQRYSYWRKFNKKPTKRNAIAMRNALQRILDHSIQTSGLKERPYYDLAEMSKLRCL